MVVFTRENNDQLNIPDEVMMLARNSCRDTHVIDLGSGQHNNMHIDFLAHAYTRIDRNGIVQSPSFGPVFNFSDAIRITPSHIPITIVLFRSFSCFSIDFVQDFTKLFNEHRTTIASLIVYDYAIDLEKLNEYEKISSPFGTLFQKATEWHDEPFYHYSPEIIGRILSLRRYRSISTTVPAMKHANVPGFFVQASRHQDDF